MFNKEDMMVSLVVAENKVGEVEQELRNEAKERELSLVGVINNMKAKSEIKGKVSMHNAYFDIGEKTGINCSGLELYSGDEVQTSGSIQGVVIITRGGVMVYTNKEVFRIEAGENGEAKNIFFGKLRITKHFNELEDGEEYAKGRSGGKGFTAHIVCRGVVKGEH